MPFRLRVCTRFTHFILGYWEVTMEDYYKILGVEKSASDTQIKAAYRKLALKHHPDRNQGDKNAETEFKKVSEAYAALSDPAKRKQYDQFGASGFHQKYSSEDIFRGTDFSSIFNEFGFGNGGPGAGGGGGGFDAILSQLFGGAAMGGGGRHAGYGAGPQARKGENIETSVNVGFLEAYEGGQRTLRVGGQEIFVKIPAGIQSGQKLRVAGKGQPGSGGGPAGDIMIAITVNDHPDFRREGQDIIAPLNLLPSEAFLGCSKEIATPAGPKKLKVPEGVSSSTKLRLKGLGFPSVKGGKGDFYAEVKISLPPNLSTSQREAVMALKNVGL